MTTKVCRECGRRKEIEAFPLRRDSRDGHHTLCRDCRAEEQRERRRLTRPDTDAEYQERVRAWQERALARHAAENAERRALGQPELPEPDVEPGWLERLQERAREKLRQ